MFSGAVAPTERIYSLRREATDFYRAVHPLLAVVTTVERATQAPQLQPYLRDVQDHLLVSEEAAAQRDLLGTVLEANMAVISVEQTKVSVRQNTTIEQLTILATVFLPLTFITGFFGQNFAWLIRHISSYTAFLAPGRSGRPGRARRRSPAGVPGGVDVLAPVPFDLPAREVVMGGEESGPAGVTEFGQPLGRADDVGKQDRGKDAVQACPVPLAGQERLDLVNDRVHLAYVRRVITPRQSYQCCAADLGGHIFPELRRRIRELGAVQQEGGDVDGREHCPDVGFHVEPLDRLSRRRIRREREHRQRPVLEDQR